MADEKTRVQDERNALAVLDAEGLTARLNEEKKKLWTNRFALGKRMLENTAEIGKSRKTIARINTYLRKIELTQGAVK